MRWTLKKILSVLVLLVVFFGNVIPASAKGKASEVQVSVAAPTTAVAGTSFDILLSANKLGWKFGEQKLQLDFPASAVKSAYCRDNSWGWRLKDENKNSLRYEWKFKLSFWRQTAQLKCTVTLKSSLTPSQVVYLNLFDKKAEILMGRYTISVIKPTIKWSSVSPDKIKMGEVPFDVVIVAKNETAFDLPVDMNVFVFYKGGVTNRHLIYDKPTSGSVDKFDGNNEGVTIHWTGIIKAKQTGVLVIHLESIKTGWSFPGSYPLFKMYGEGGTYQSLVKLITLE
jgi:hypothetical protein